MLSIFIWVLINNDTKVVISGTLGCHPVRLGSSALMHCCNESGVELLSLDPQLQSLASPDGQ
jgi:hypothetical protein